MTKRIIIIVIISSILFHHDCNCANVPFLVLVGQKINFGNRNILSRTEKFTSTLLTQAKTSAKRRILEKKSFASYKWRPDYGENDDFYFIQLFYKVLFSEKTNRRMVSVLVHLLKSFYLNRHSRTL